MNFFVSFCWFVFFGLASPYAFANPNFGYSDQGELMIKYEDSKNFERYRVVEAHELKDILEGPPSQVTHDLLQLLGANDAEEALGLLEGRDREATLHKSFIEGADDENEDFSTCSTPPKSSPAPTSLSSLIQLASQLQNLTSAEHSNPALLNKFSSHNVDYSPSGLKNHFPLGSAFVTNSGVLKNSGIPLLIQAASGSMGGTPKDFEPTLESVGNSVWNSVELAHKNSLDKIVIPFIGGQIFLSRIQAQDPSATSEKLAETIIENALKAREAAQSTVGIIFSPYTPAEKQIFDRALRAVIAKGHSGANCVVEQGSPVDVAKKAGQVQGTQVGLVNAANTEGRFGFGLSGIIGKATQSAAAIDREAAQLLKTVNTEVAKILKNQFPSPSAVQAQVKATAAPKTQTASKKHSSSGNSGGVVSEVDYESTIFSRSAVQRDDFQPERRKKLKEFFTNPNFKYNVNDYDLGIEDHFKVLWLAPMTDPADGMLLMNLYPSYSKEMAEFVVFKPECFSPNPAQPNRFANSEVQPLLEFASKDPTGRRMAVLRIVLKHMIAKLPHLPKRPNL